MAYYDLFKTGNFRIQLKDQTNLEFFVQETTVPGVTVGTIDIGYGSMKDVRPGDSLEFNPLTLTVICDEDLQAYKDVYTYILKMTHNPVTNVIQVDPEVFDAYLLLTTNKNNITHRLHFHDMWIESISDLQLQTVSPDENNISFTVGLKYVYYLFEEV
jgi:hypothetical protein